MPGILKALAERIHSVEARSTGAFRTVPTGLDAIDRALPHGGLRAGAVHEWFGVEGTADAPPRASWTPPLILLIHLARQASRHGAAVLWVGRHVWPSVHSLTENGGSLLAASLFADPADAGARLWTVDAALRCPGTVVIADGSRMNAASSRRLQLAAEAGGSLGLLARPMQESRELSVAATRWTVVRTGAGGQEQRWSICLVRSKGVDAMVTQERSWMVERMSSGGIVVVSPDLDVRLDAAPAAA